LPFPPEVPPSGFGYPLGGFRALQPQKHVSASNAHGLYPSEPCSFPMVRASFRRPLSAPALLFKTHKALKRRLSGFIPPGKPYPSSLPEDLIRVGTLALLGLSGLSGFPAICTVRRNSLPPDSPPVLVSHVAHTACIPGPQGLSAQIARRFPHFCGRRPVWPF